MEESLRRYVRSRAGDRCEYCRLRQEHETLTPFHVEHVIAAQQAARMRTTIWLWRAHGVI